MDGMNAFEGFIVVVLAIALVVGLNALVVWLLCWGLKAIGIYAIGGWTVAFSWPLVLVFVIVCSTLGGIFKK